MNEAAAAYNPGGKVTVKLPSGVIGTAEFSSCGRYRHLLTRDWTAYGIGGAQERPRVVWIGMNPSTATAEVDDPTMIRVRGFTERFGYSSYAMCNVMDYRTTNPSFLTSASVNPCSSNNLFAIFKACEDAKLIIAAWGALGPTLSKYARIVKSELTASGHELWCLGMTKYGQPRHPLYLRKDAELIRF